MKAHFMFEPTQAGSRRARDGFTLLELLVSLMIIGIVIAMVMPKVGRTMSETRVQRAATVVASDIQRAFSLAAQRRSPVRISIDTAAKAFYIRNRARDTMYVTNTYTSSSDIGVTRMQASDTTVLVYPNGLANTPFNVTLTAGGNNRRRVTATRAGQVRIITP
jgi:type II secretion system protein H